MAGPEKAGIVKNQLGWNCSFGKKFLIAVDIGQNCLKEHRPLAQAAFKHAPFSGGQREGDGLKGPGCAASARIIKGIKGRAVLMTHPSRPKLPFHQGFRAKGVKSGDKVPPVFAHFACCRKCFVIAISRHVQRHKERGARLCFFWPVFVSHAVFSRTSAAK